MIDLADLEPEELYALKEALSQIIVFGPWTKLSGRNEFVRPELERMLSDSRVSVWHSGEDSNLKAGWHYRIGYGIPGVFGVTGRVPYEYAKDCMNAADDYLADIPNLQLIGVAIDDSA